jgi:8-oxo-dGTP diphosphatase
MSALVLHVAAKAVILSPKGQVLILREASSAAHPTNTKSGRYQLPGGRLESGEAFEEGLRREVSEETGLVIEIGKPLLVGEWRPIVQGVPRQIIGVFMIAKSSSEKITLSGEHDKFLWIDPRKRAEYDIVPPDWEAIDTYIAGASMSKL